MLVDADPQGSVGLSLTRQSRLLNGFYDFLADPSLNVLGVCLTMVQADLAESREVAASLRQLLPPDLVFQTQIPRDPLFVRASARGLPTTWESCGPPPAGPPGGRSLPALAALGGYAYGQPTALLTGDPYLMADDTKKTLQTQLWNIANTLRGKMGADEFRDYILGFIFYKYLSERMHLFADEILKHDGIRFDQIDETKKKGREMLAAIQEEAIERLGYFLKPSELFHQIAEKGARKTDNFILEDLTAVLKHIEASTMGHASEDDFEGLFEDLDIDSSKLGKTPSQKNELIAKVLAHLDKIDFRLADTEADVLGDAYEYLIGQFASGAGKKAGEFYTPQEVSIILAKIVTTGKKKLKSVYDPTCGSGSLLLRVAKEVDDVGHFYGQEMNPTTYNLARMNMILHGVHYQRFDLKNEDTLEHPAPEHADLRFEAIVANPPFSADWSASAIHENDDRFSPYGRLAPKTKADFAFVQHMVHHLASGGTMACVLPHGVLFRGAAEGHIRKYLIEECNYLDAVIGLPANIFYGAGIPTCILVFKKQRKNPDDILFIDASQGFEKVGNQNYLRPEDIERIVSTYRKRASIAKFSKVAERSEVEENDYNLNIPRYVDTFDAEEAVDLDKIAGKLAALEKEMGGTDKVIAGFCAELGIKAPF